MSLYGEYDPQNIFAKILRGDLPCYKIYEDAHVLSFLDLFPQSRGHALVLPKNAAARNLLEIDPQSLCALYAGVQTVARGVVAELEPEGLQIMQFNGAAGGQTVFHIHVHLIPRWPGEEPGPHARTKADPAELEALAKRLSARLAAA